MYFIYLLLLPICWPFWQEDTQALLFKCWLEKWLKNWKSAQKADGILLIRQNLKQQPLIFSRGWKHENWLIHQWLSVSVSVTGWFVKWKAWLQGLLVFNIRPAEVSMTKTINLYQGVARCASLCTVTLPTWVQTWSSGINHREEDWFPKAS